LTRKKRNANEPQINTGDRLIGKGKTQIARDAKTAKQSKIEENRRDPVIAVPGRNGTSSRVIGSEKQRTARFRVELPESASQGRLARDPSTSAHSQARSQSLRMTTRFELDGVR
jgi:hypothetical protein